MTLQSPRPEATPAGSECLLEARNLYKTVSTQDGGLTILHDISFRIKPRESVAIVGSSGSGKSTLLGLLAGLDTPSQGQVFFDGGDFSAQDEDQRAALRQRNIGFVFQNFQLLPHLSAEENVMLPLELARLPATAAREWLERVGLAHRLRHTPRQLSGGEQQRVAIARAFASQPRILFADEPTGNLDSRTGAQIVDLLFQANQEAGTTLVLVTHDAQLAARCQRRLHLEAGRLVEAD